MKMFVACSIHGHMLRAGGDVQMGSATPSKLAESRAECVENLRTIENAIKKWAVQHRIPEGHEVEHQGLQQSFGGPIPTCPGGGRYREWNWKVGDRPYCTLGHFLEHPAGEAKNTESSPAKSNDSKALPAHFFRASGFEGTYGPDKLKIVFSRSPSGNDGIEAAAYVTRNPWRYTGRFDGGVLALTNVTGSMRWVLEFDSNGTSLKGQSSPIPPRERTLPIFIHLQ